MTENDIKAAVEEALMAWFRGKVREGLPEEHKHIADTDQMRDVVFGGMFVVNTRLADDLMFVDAKQSAGKLMEAISGFAPVFVHAVLDAVREARRCGGISAVPRVGMLPDVEHPFADLPTLKAGWGDEWELASCTIREPHEHLYEDTAEHHCASDALKKCACEAVDDAGYCLQCGCKTSTFDLCRPYLPALRGDEEWTIGESNTKTWKCPCAVVEEAHCINCGAECTLNTCVVLGDPEC